MTYRTRRSHVFFFGCLIAASSCILESNPDYDALVGDDGASGTTSDRAEEADSTIEGQTDSSPSVEGGATGEPEPVAEGCSEAECIELHVGFSANGCPRDGGAGCDFVGPEGIREAAATADAMGGARILVHDDQGQPAFYNATIDVYANTTLGAAPGVDAGQVILDWQPDDEGIIRVMGDGVHLHDLTLSCPAGCSQAIIARSDPNDEQTATRGHLFERLDIGAIHPELFGDNGIDTPLILGADTVLRNSHVWGYWDGTLTAANADGLVLHNNTFVWYETPDLPFDLSEATNVQIANNVFVNLGQRVPALVAVGRATDSAIVVGNLVQGFSAVVGGLDQVGPSNVIEGAIVESAPLESPRSPTVLSNAELVANLEMAAIGGTSMDDVQLTSTGAALLPGAFQLRSARALPRPAIVTLGPTAQACDPSPCDHVQVDGDSLQIAVWSTWPGAELQLFEGDYSGAVLTWALSLRGRAVDVDDVRLQTGTDGFLVERGLLSRNEAVLRLQPHTAQPSLIAGLTLLAGEEEHGILVETTQASSPALPHELSRVAVASTADDDGLSGAALHLGDNVYAHDVLIQGAFESCLRTGPRAQNTDPTPQTRTFVHNLTCRLTEDGNGDGDGDGLAAFEVAGAVDSVWFNNVVELDDGGPIFRAQRRAGGGRRGGGDDDDPVAVDAPTGFIAQSWLIIRPGGENLDGFEPGEAFGLVGLQEAVPGQQVFQTPFDAHLVGPGLDIGIDPTTLGEPSIVGVSLDGVDRTGRAIDLGCYEQGF